VGELFKSLDTIFRVADRYPWLRPLLVFSGTFATAWWLLGQHFGPRDFSIFYLAAEPGPIYDPAWIEGLEKHPGVWAFAYPPTFLLILRPLHLLPYPAAFSLWVAGAAVLFVEAAGRLSRLPWVLLLTPVVVSGAFLGQTPMFIGGLVVLGMTLLDAPLLAGALFGLAFVIKPQVMLLLPIALAMSCHWRVLLAMGAAGVALCVASLVFGPALWFEWVRCLPGFVAINAATATISTISVPAAFIPAIAAVSLVALWLTRRADVSVRLLVLIGGSLLLSPHAVEYELAMLLPPLLGLAYRWRSLVYRAPRLSRSA
jgi:hypothetical protein